MTTDTEEQPVELFLNSIKHNIKFNYVWILCNRTDFNLLLDKLSQPNMAASSGLSGKLFFPATWNFNILNDIIIAMIYYPFDIIAL